MDEKIKPLLAAFCGALTALAENYGTICSICCALTVSYTHLDVYKRQVVA